MKKNLKKVISAVIALAMSLSSVVALAANKSFTDVAESASYYQAVTTLANLGIIAGYEDGSFKPDEKITRAEVTTMVVAAMNLSEQADSMKGTTKFSDMQSAATEWASGYVNCGVANKFIAGYEDGTFRPGNNVQYAHIITMLVGALNYGDYATYMGGYPDGYIQIARTSGLTKGIAANATDEMTRAQVAVLIYNFLDTAKVEMDGMSWNSFGELVPNVAIQDGTDDTYYRTILTENWGIYILEGTVTATSKSDSGSALDADEVMFEIGKTKEKNNVNGYDDPSSDDINAVGNEIIANVGATDAANYLNTYAVIYAQYTDNDEWVIKHFEESGKNKSVKFAAGLIDDEDYLIDADKDTRDYVRFYATADANKSTKYSLDNAVLYVNGRAVNGTNAITEADFEEYILNNDAGEVELIDQYSSKQASDGYYDIINVTYYATAMVDAVVAKTGRISFEEYTSNAAGSITLDPEDEDLEYSITLDGTEIAVTDLKADDVLTIAYDVTGEFKNSDFYDIMVSRDTAEGRYSGKNKSSRTVTLGSDKYELTELAAETPTLNTKEKRFEDKVDKGLGMVLANEYKAYLDVFGRIFSVEVSKNAAKIGILDKVANDPNKYDTYAVTLYTADGVAKTYEIDSKINDEFDDYTEAVAVVYKNGVIKNADKKALTDRVVEYKINSKGFVSSLEVLPADSAEVDKEYRTLSNAVGSVRMNSTTIVVDATDYMTNEDYEVGTGKASDLSLTTVEAAFRAGTTYTIFGYGDKVGNAYPYVIVTSGEGTYDEDTRLAVLTESATQVVEDGEAFNAIVVLTAESDDEVTIAISDNSNVSDNVLDVLDKGDVVVYTLDALGQIKTLDVVFKGSEYSDPDDLRDAIMAADDVDESGLVTVPANAPTWTAEWDPQDSDQSVQIVAGPVVDKTSGSITIGKIGTDATYGGAYTDMNATEDEEAGLFEVDASNGQTRVYAYQLDGRASQNLGVGDVSDIIACDFVPNDLIDDTIIPWDELESTAMCYVVAKVVDGLATDVLVLYHD